MRSDAVLTRRTGLSLVALLVCASVDALAQPAPPNPLGQPLLDAAGVVREDACIRVPLRPAAERYSARPRRGCHLNPRRGARVRSGLAPWRERGRLPGSGCRGQGSAHPRHPPARHTAHSIRDEDAVARAIERGAAAVGIVYGISDNFAVWQRTGDRPGFNVGYEDGMRLRDLLGLGERVTVRHTMESELRTGLTAASVWGIQPGVSEEEILIIAHMDGYAKIIDGVATLSRAQLQPATVSSATAGQ